MSPRAVTGTVLMGMMLAFSDCRFVYGQISFPVAFQDPGGSYASYYDDIEATMMAAGAMWAEHLDATASLEINVAFDETLETATGGSVTTSFVASRGGLEVFELGATAELRTGSDPNGETVDIEVTVGRDYLENELWFDPDPFVAIEPVPTDRTDAVGTFAHEIGHAIAFQGFRDWVTGELSDVFATPFDEFVLNEDDNFWFVGDAAVAEYGGPVPLTYENIMHVGNDSPRPGSDLLHDIMNGVTGMRGHRYEISRIDLAIMQDVGLPVILPDILLGDGDFNGNRLVEQGDLDLVLLHWGDAAASVSDAWIHDLPAGLVDQEELDAVLLNWGEGSVTTPTTAVVPEPNALSAVVTVIMVMGFLAAARDTSSQRKQVD